MDAIILSIGDELVLGQTVDTNSAWLSQQLAAVGVGVRAHVTVPDDQPAIERAIRESAGQCDFLLISGGIGPTEDDLTRQALAAVMGVPLEENPTWLAELHKFFEARGRTMPPINRIQAMIPRGARMIFNHAGTAAGIEAVLANPGKGTKGRRDEATKGDEEPMKRERDEATRGAEDKHFVPPSLSPFVPSTRVFGMPGVPKEMKAMFTRDVLPHVQSAAGGAVILSRTLHTFGLGESAIAEKLGDLMRRDRNPSVGTTVSAGIVSLRINSRFASAEQALQELDRTSAACHDALGHLIFGEDEQTLQEVVGRLLIAIRHTPGTRKLTVTTAESCTGGLVAKMLTDVPGSSTYFTHGWVTYANEAKTQLLGVPASLLAEHGAVSEPVVRAMAEGARQRAEATYALAISGIAGPDGGTPQKPVGTVWLALAHPNGTDARVFLFPGDREMVRDRSAKMALTMFRYRLYGKSLPF